MGDATYRLRSTPRITDPALAALVDGLDGVALHAASLAFTHPVTGARLEFASPLPNRIERLLFHLRTTQGARRTR